MSLPRRLRRLRRLRHIPVDEGDSDACVAKVNNSNRRHVRHCNLFAAACTTATAAFERRCLEAGLVRVHMGWAGGWPLHWGCEDQRGHRRAPLILTRGMNSAAGDRDEIRAAPVILMHGSSRRTTPIIRLVCHLRVCEDKPLDTNRPRPSDTIDQSVAYA